MTGPEIVGSAVASAVDGERIEMYFVRSDETCELLWQYDGLGDPSGRRRYLSVVLSESETRAVFERDAAHQWILEPVREQLEGRDALVVQNALEGGDLLGGTSIKLTGLELEGGFLDSLDATEVTTVGDHKRSLRKLRARVAERERAVDDLLATPALWTRPVLLWRVLRLRSDVRKDRRDIEHALGERREAQAIGRSERHQAMAQPA